jgi:hypothetical protein
VNFIDRFSKIPHTSNSMKILPHGAELIHADGQTHTLTDGRTDGHTDRRTDITKLIVDFRNVANVPKRVYDITMLSSFINYNF